MDLVPSPYEDGENIEVADTIDLCMLIIPKKQNPIFFHLLTDHFKKLLFIYIFLFCLPTRDRVAEALLTCC